MIAGLNGQEAPDPPTPRPDWTALGLLHGPGRSWPDQGRYGKARTDPPRYDTAGNPFPKSDMP